MFESKFLDDVTDVQREAEMLLLDIRAEIKYAESSLHCNFSSTDCTTNDPGIKPCQNGTRCDTNENFKRSSINSTFSETSLNEENSRVEGWGKSFERLLSDPIGFHCFQEFLKKEFSEENVLFWVQCERFKEIKNIEKMKEFAREIFKYYLAPSAPYLVNVDQNAVKIVEEKLSTPHPEMFTKPQEQVFHLMKFDSYNRFLKSNIYKDCEEADNEGRSLPYQDEVEQELQKEAIHGESSDGMIDLKKSMVNYKSKESFEGKIVRAENTVEDDNQLWDGLHTKAKGNFFRVILPDETSTVAVGESGKTLRELVHEICKNKNILLSTIEVTLGYSKEIVPLDRDISSIKEKVVFLERRVLFRFDLPNGRSVGVKANPTKTLSAVLQPLMKKNGFDINNYSVQLASSKYVLSLNSNISTVENKHLITRFAHKKLEKQSSDSATLKHGSDFRSSLRRFRTNSFKEEKGRLEKQHSSSEIQRSEKGKNILGRTKSNDDGASALMSVLQRSQSGRLDDQRGVAIADVEIPEFLKVTCSTPTLGRSDISENKFSKSTKSYPASPLIIDRHPPNEDNLNTSINSEIYSVTSWKEVPSLDREIIGKEFESSLFYDNTGSIKTEKKACLMEINRNSTVVQSDHTRKEISQKAPECKVEQSSNFAKSSLERRVKLKSITNYSESEILQGLETDGYAIIGSSNNKVLKEGQSTNNEIDNCNALIPKHLGDETIFQLNAVPTSEQSKLLNGETVISRKNERITFV